MVIATKYLGIYFSSNLGIGTEFGHLRRIKEKVGTGITVHRQYRTLRSPDDNPDKH